MKAPEERSRSLLVCSRQRYVGLVLVFIVLCAGARASSGDAPSARSAALSRALQSAVFIEVGRVYRGEEIWTTGSGFFASKDGHVLTNSHVVSDYIELEFSDETVLVEVNVVEIRVVVGPRTEHEQILPARVVDVDRKRDLALLKVGLESPMFLELDPGRDVTLTDEVFVMGFPFGEMLTFDSRGKLSKDGGYPEVSINGGRVTSLRRDDRGNVVAIQTDADINPGSSGGPMVDADGRLVGVVYAELNGDNQIGFAVSAERVAHFLAQQLIRASFDPPYVAEDLRPIVVSVTPGELLGGTPRAGAAVLRSGDAIVGEFELHQRNDIWMAVVELPGATRGGFTLEVRLADGDGRRLAERLYNLRHESDLPAGARRANAPQVIKNELSIHDYARKQAAEKAVEEGTVISSSSSRSAGQSGSTVGDAGNATEPPVDLTALRNQARAFYRAGEYEVAAEIFSQIVAADPDDEVARDYLDLAQGRHQVELDARISGDGATPVSVSLTVMSRAKRGIVRFAVDGETVSPFEFDKHGNAHEFTVPAGHHTLTVEFEVSGDLRGSSSFERDFAPGSEWTLRIDHPSADATASIFFIERDTL